MFWVIIFIVSGLGILFWYFIYLFPEFYVSELFLSYLPYLLVVFCVIFLLFFIVFVISFFWKYKKFYWNSLWMFRLFGLILSVFSFVLVLLYWKVFFDFYSNINLNFVESETNFTGDKLNILYANIFWKNDKYSDLQKLIEEKNPDILMFVEFSDHHYEALKDFLAKSYPYVNRTTWSKDLMVGWIVFSKYPINNLSEDFPQWSWRYWYFSVDYAGEKYYFYLVHTSSPIGLWYFEMRNRQFGVLMKDFALHALSRDSNRIVFVGDFNITPWSYYYDVLNDWLWSGFVNSSANMFRFSWHTPKIPLFWAHIDHVISSSILDVSVEKTLTIPGSDHGGYLFEVSW